MINALRALQRQFDPQTAAMEAGRGQQFKALMISGRAGGLMALLSTHPPLEERIARLESVRS
jgi:heat shock protein HtpX